MPKLNILIIADYFPGDAAVIRHHLFSFDRHSNHKIFYLFWPSKHKDDIDFSHFDVIIVHWCIYITKFGQNGPSIPPRMADQIQRSSALKVLFLQDEYRRMNAVHGAINALGINLMMTCAPEGVHEHIYPPEKFPRLDGLHTVLTGYVSDDLLKHSKRMSGAKNRPIDFGYRSRRLPYSLGRLGYEKTSVCVNSQNALQESGYTFNLSINESDRLYGNNWLNFLSQCSCQLGTPSGASIVDFTGEIEDSVQRHMERHPNATFQEVYDTLLSDVDGKIVIDTISPRVFEYTAFGCSMLMTRGEYGGILEPNVHYMPINKDFSNLNEAIEASMDPAIRSSLLANSRRDLLENDKYSYKSFIRWFNGVITEEQQYILRSRRRSALAFHVKQAVDQRHPTLAAFRRDFHIPWPLLSRIKHTTKETAERIIETIIFSPRLTAHKIYSKVPLVHYPVGILRMLISSPRAAARKAYSKVPWAHYPIGVLRMAISSPRQAIRKAYHRMHAILGR